GPEEACELLETWAGIHYDPEVVAVLRASLASIVVSAGRAAAGPVAGVEVPVPNARARVFQPGVAAVWSTPDPADSRDFQDLLHRGVSVDGERAGAHGASRTETGGAAADAGAAARTVLSDISSAHREVYALYEIAQTLGSSLRLVE